MHLSANFSIALDILSWLFVNICKLISSATLALQLFNVADLISLKEWTSQVPTSLSNFGI